jgi:hypothetical protein
MAANAPLIATIRMMCPPIIRMPFPQAVKNALKDDASRTDWVTVHRDLPI